MASEPVLSYFHKLPKHLATAGLAMMTGSDNNTSGSGTNVLKLTCTFPTPGSPSVWRAVSELPTWRYEFEVLTIALVFTSMLCCAELTWFYTSLLRRRLKEARVNDRRALVDELEEAREIAREEEVELHWQGDSGARGSGGSYGDDVFSSNSKSSNPLLSPLRFEGNESERYQRAVVSLLLIVSLAEFFFAFFKLVGKALDPLEYAIGNFWYLDNCPLYKIWVNFYTMSYFAPIVPSLLLAFFIQRMSTSNPLMIGYPLFLRRFENYVAFQVSPIIAALVGMMVTFALILSISAFHYVFVSVDTGVIYIIFLTSPSLVVVFLSCVYYVRAWNYREEFSSYAGIAICQFVFYFAVIGIGGAALIGMEFDFMSTGLVTTLEVTISVLEASTGIAMYIARSYAFPRATTL
eukprot:TRINITY_DN17262_c0_g1_i1.p1 TRINITY_DN17262_c0_g1~~TRINITY_DN17262_c0_g1_i1.p1  ORF type:complete len:407 (-),score=61.64 TRINITY_DN17262_c0_g1_i1:35-1255(-)